MEKEIKRFPGYFANENGDIISYRTSGRYSYVSDIPHILKPSFTKTGYAIVNLRNKNGYKNEYIHRLVLEAFIGECPPGHQACHNNDKKSDNRLSNLRWDTHRNNQRDMVKNGNSVKGEKNPQHKLTSSQVIEIRKRIFNGEMPTKVAKKFGISYRHLWTISANKRWIHL